MTLIREFHKLMVILWVVFAGCSKEESRVPAKPAEPAPAAAPVVNSSSPGQAVGTITGKIVFKGSHAPGKVAVSKDKEVCGDSKLDPALAIGSQGEVKNAVIQIAELKQSKRVSKEAVLEQVKCEYRPHVLAIPVGAAVKIGNSDGILHNVHSLSVKNPPFNRAQPKYLKEIRQEFTEPEVISLRCDVHGWMSGWIVVTDRAFYDVTSSDGSFKMDTIPVGKYTLDVWHETLGKTSQSVEVKSGEVTHVTFEFQLKK